MKPEQICRTCIHFGMLKSRSGICKFYLCLAPITTDPPKDGETRANFPFVYETDLNLTCELWTGEKL